MKALLSVYDKTGLVDFARSLKRMGYDLVSTGGTYKELTQAGLDVQQVAELTGSPEILGGRVKTLHPKIHGGILARRDIPGDISQLADHEIETIDLVAVNLYPFRETVSKPSITLQEALENIDIGGPTMVRAAAKNFPHVVIVVDYKDYPWIVDRLSQTSDLTMDERQALGRKAFQHVALYDTAISVYLGESEDSTFTAEMTIGMEKINDLRYGENPHQKAALYTLGSSAGGIAQAHQLHGKELSYNNLLDADGAWTTVSDFTEPTVAVIKHTNPCGLAIHEDIAEAYRRAYNGDPVSAFGGIVAFNRPVTTAAATAMSSIFYEVIIAPDYEPEALDALKKKKNLRILVANHSSKHNLEVRQISGGLLVQTADNPQEDPATWKTVTKRRPSSQEMLDLTFAWKAVKHIKSNAIVMAKGRQLLGMGAGQPNRVISVHLAAQAAKENAQESVLASDAFFPFPDGIEAAAKAGASAIIQPGGSIRDEEVINAADSLNIAMVFTGVRHFKH